MPNVRRWAARGIDTLAIAVVLFAVYHFFIAPRYAQPTATPAPPISLGSLEGGRFSLASQHGRVVFLDFWASWCEPCKISLPLVEHYARTHRDVDVIAVDVGEDAVVAGNFARANGIARVVLDPDQTAGRAFGVEAFPTIVVIDPTGVMRAKWVGFNPAVELAMADASQRYGPAHRITSFVRPAQR